MKEFEIEKEDGFFIGPSIIGRNKNLSLTAKGLMYVFFTLPPEWDYSFNGLVSICKEGKHLVRRTINELKEAGFIEISQYRDDKGHYQYKYMVFRKPRLERHLCENSPRPDLRTSVNQHQLNNKKLKDKIDKTKNTVFEHNILSNELIKTGYVDEKEDNLLFLFDELFKKELDKGHSYKELFGAIHYIVPKVISRNFLDEDGNEIENKYGYFKTSLNDNFKKFEATIGELWEDEKNIGDERSER